MSHYLFAHFREKTTPMGEQVYFGLSADGFNWEEVNGGQPVLWAYYGDKGVRDHTIMRLPNEDKFVIVSTDLSLAYGFRNQYKSSWREINVNGSKYFSIWESSDLVHWSEQRRIKLGTDDMGCLWAPDIIYDRKADDYILHWSSSYSANDYRQMCIYYSRTKDFVTFSEPEVLYKKEDSGCIDSAMYEEDGRYYLFVKSEGNPETIIMLESDSPTGPWVRHMGFSESISGIEKGLYEAATMLRLPDGRCSLFLDFYGTRDGGQGYVPFVADSLAAGNFKRSDADFSFPYGFKHGTILEITEEEYERIKAFNFDIEDYSKY